MKIGSIVIDCHEFARMVDLAKPASLRAQIPGSRRMVVLRDSEGKGPNLSFQARDSRRPRRNWIHLDLHIGSSR